jgi:predicted phage gp36 major capsid-like protein
MRASLLIALIWLSPFSTGTSPLPVGEWNNIDAQTKSITRIIISAPSEIHVYAKCSPTDCDWKTVPLQSLGSDRYRAEFRATEETNTLQIAWEKDPKNPEGVLKVTDATVHAAQNGQRGWSKTSPVMVFARSVRR